MGEQRFNVFSMDVGAFKGCRWTFTPFGAAGVVVAAQETCVCLAGWQRITLFV